MQFPIIATGGGDFNCFVQKNKKGFPNREALGEEETVRLGLETASVLRGMFHV